MGYTREQRIINNLSGSTKAQRNQPIQGKDQEGFVLPNPSVAAAGKQINANYASVKFGTNGVIREYLTGRGWHEISTDRENTDSGLQIQIPDETTSPFYYGYGGDSQHLFGRNGGLRLNYAGGYHIFIPDTARLYFRDNDINMYSNQDGVLSIDAGTQINLATNSNRLNIGATTRIPNGLAYVSLNNAGTGEISLISGTSADGITSGNNAFSGNWDIRNSGGSAAGVKFRIDTSGNQIMFDGHTYIRSDSKKLYLGAGNDGSITYDGTDMVYNSQEVGTGDHLFTGGPIRQEGIFAEIYLNDGSTAQSIPTGATYTKLTGFTTNGESSNCTADVSNDKITITKTGRYFVTFSFSGDSGTANVLFRKAVFLGGTEQNQVHTSRKYTVANDIGNDSTSGIIDVTSVPVDLDLRARHDNGGSVNLTPQYMSLNLHYLGET